MQSTIAAAFDALAGAYDKDSYHEQIAALLVEAAPPATGDVVIDVATGTGQVAFAALRLSRPARLVALDVSAEMVRHAKLRAEQQDPDHLIEWFHQDANELPFQDSTIDLLYCSSSLHFLGRSALHEWTRVLRPGGIAAFTLPLARSFRPSAEFRKLLPPDAVPLPQSEESAEQVLLGTQLRFLRPPTVVTTPVGGDDQKAVLLMIAEKAGA
jgi:ubiquinone/menaquinone biosynthesis C-methylase UbiE